MSGLRPEVKRALMSKIALEPKTRRGRERCQAVTGWGHQCTFEAYPGKRYCGKHFFSQFARAKADAP